MKPVRTDLFDDNKTSRKRYAEAGLYLLIWIFLFELNYLFIGNYSVKADPLFEAGVWLLYIIIFFLNYFLLMPWFFFRKKIIIYIICSAIMLSGAFIVKYSLTEKHFDKMQTELQERSSNNSEIRTPPFPPIQQSFPQDHGRILFITYGIMLSYLFSLSLGFIQKWQEEDKRKKEIENANISTELSFLKQQVNPHFLFNSLNSIYSLALTHSESTLDAILKLSSILRYMLYDTDKTNVLIRDELSVINDYIELQRLRTTEKLHLDFRTNGEPGLHQVAPFIILPLVENAFKHGTDTSHDSYITILITVRDRDMHLHVSNSIVQNPGDSTGSGIGLKNIKRRLDLLYPGEHRLDINKKDDIFTVDLEIKLR